MPTAFLRLINGTTMEELPPVCLFCGRDVEDFCYTFLRSGNWGLRAALPLCREHRAKEMYVGGISLLGGSTIDRTVPFNTASPRFIRALQDLRRERLAEFERGLKAPPPAKKEQQQPNADPTAFAGLGDPDNSPAAQAARKGKGCLGGIALLAGGPLLLAALAVFG
jgi:hypothetical protein